MKPPTYSDPASVHIAHPPRYTVLGMDISVHLTAKQTGGRFSLTETMFPPAIDNGFHLHRHESESLFMLEGMVALQIGKEQVDLATGQSCFIARGTPHRIRNLTDKSARILVIHTPAIVDRLIAEIGTPIRQHNQPTTQAEVAALVATLDRYGIEILTSPDAD